MGGSSLRACGPDGTWNGTQPSCHISSDGVVKFLNYCSTIYVPLFICAVNCNISEIVGPAKGRVSVEGVNAIYTCDTGYTLVGRRIRACNSSGNWEATTPTCQSEPVIIVSSTI